MEGALPVPCPGLNKRLAQGSEPWSPAPARREPWRDAAGRGMHLSLGQGDGWEGHAAASALEGSWDMPLGWAFSHGRASVW